MAKQLSAEMARLYLSDVPYENHFWVCDNQRLYNLEDLARALKSMNEDVYGYHVNASKNDFYAWVVEVVKDTTLADSLKKAKRREELLKKLEQRIAKLKKTACVQ